MNPHETKLRSFTKAVSWRLTGTIITFITAYIKTGEIAASAQISISAAILLFAAYYLHERVWSRAHWGMMHDES